jgi:predicted transcriptional regulator of viral defense system
MKNTTYSNLSKDELLLISRVEYENRKLITNEFTKKVFGDAKKAANTVDRLRKKGRLIQLERGKYILVPIKAPNQLWTPNEFVVASLWMGDAPYYIGYFTMYNYWGFTEQVPQTVFILNTQKSRTKKIGDTHYKAIKIKSDKYYGVEKIKIEDVEIAISDRERTLVDFIYNPIGSFETLKQVIEQNINKIDAQKFIKYLIQFPEASVRKRAGCILEHLNYPRKLLDKLKKSLGRQETYIVLNMFNRSRKGKINKDWGLIVNT